MEAASLSALYKLVLYSGEPAARQKFLSSLVTRLRGSGDATEREAVVGALSVLNLKVYGGEAATDWPDVADPARCDESRPG